MFAKTHPQEIQTLASEQSRQTAPTKAKRAEKRKLVNQLGLNELRRLFGQEVKASTGNTIEQQALRPALMAGKFTSDCLRQGFFLHCTDILHMQDMTSRFPSLEASLKILLKLEGNAIVKIGHRTIALDAGQGTDTKPQGALVTLAQPEDFERTCRAGTRERMVVITLTPEWFHATGLRFEDYQPHLCLRPWQPSTRAISLAEQLIQPITGQSTTLNLYQESRALELIAEALESLHDSLEPMASPLRLAEYQRITRLKRLLDSGEADHLSMTKIAQAVGCNASTLQRQFRQIEGLSIFDYLRESRLKRAALAIEKNGLSVAYAASIAGYSSQANFSTAFRKQFGISPKALKSK